jgi:hypothetical protein
MLETKFCAHGLDKKSIVCTVVFALFWPEACKQGRSGAERFREDMESIYKRMATFPMVRFILLPPPDLSWKVNGLKAAHAKAVAEVKKWLPKSQYFFWEQEQYNIAQELVQTQQRSNIIVVNPIKMYSEIGLHTDGIHFSNADQMGPEKLACIFCNALKCGKSIRQLLLAHDAWSRKESRGFPARPDMLDRVIFPIFTNAEFAFWNRGAAYSDNLVQGYTQEREVVQRNGHIKKIWATVPGSRWPEVFRRTQGRVRVEHAPNFVLPAEVDCSVPGPPTVPLISVRRQKL